MTDYSKVDHQTLYNYAQSGNPGAMTNTADLWKQHAQAIQDATTGLQTNLTAIQSQWQGAAADTYFQQSQTVATKMQTHADNAGNTSAAVTNTANALSWARENMPSPPSWLEQQAADIDSNVVSGVVAGLLTGGAANAASEAAKQDIQNQHAKAISTMTQLAGAYTQAEAQLPAGAIHDDPGSGNGDGNGNGNGNGMPVMPIPVYPVGAPGGGGGYGGGGGGYSGGHAAGSKYAGVGAGGGVSGGSTYKPPAYQAPGGATHVSGFDGTPGSTGGSTNPYGGEKGSPYGSGGSTGSAFGGGFGGGAFGGVPGLGEGGLAAEGGAGKGKYGSSKYGATGLGAGDGGMPVSENAGIEGVHGSESGTGSGAEMGVAGEAQGGQGMQGMQGMGGAGGRGGGGKSEEERGNRAGYLRQDPEYWYGDKKAAPPGGVIE